MRTWGFPGGSDSKESACNAGDMSLIPGSGNSVLCSDLRGNEIQKRGDIDDLLCCTVETNTTL